MSSLAVWYNVVVVLKAVAEIAGMLTGLAVCMLYQVTTYPFFTAMTGYTMDLWFGIASISAGIFGMPAGMLTLIVVSLLTAAPSRSVQEMVENVRYPVLGNEAKQGA